MKLYFKNSKNEERLIAEPSSYREAFDAINKFLADHNYKSYYTRLHVNRDEHWIWFDVGSHSEFFYLREVPDSIIEEVFDKK